MSNLQITVQNINSELVVDSRLIASELGVLHKNLKELIKTYYADFYQLGQVAFETQAGDIRYAETFYYLNEDQCYLLLTYCKNTPQARQAKLNLVKAYKAARNTVDLPNNLIDAVEAYLIALKEKQALALVAAEAQEKVNELTPKAQDWDALCDREGLMNVETVAKVLCVKGLGRNNLFRFLRDKSILNLSNNPYQNFVDTGYFVIRIKYNQYTLKDDSVTLVTPKGFSFIKRTLEKAGYSIPTNPTPPGAAALKAA